MDEDLYPNDSTYWLPTESKELKIERAKEQAQTLEAISVLETLLERMDQRIAHYASVDSIPEDVKVDPVAFMNMHNANEMVRNNLRNEKEYIESLIETHKKSR